MPDLAFDFKFNNTHTHTQNCYWRDFFFQMIYGKVKQKK